MPRATYEDVSKSFRTGRLERELQMVELSATSCSRIAIVWISLMSFAAITLYVASQWVFIVVSVYFIIDPVRKLLDTSSYMFVVQTKLAYITATQNNRISLGEENSKLLLSFLYRERRNYYHISLPRTFPYPLSFVCYTSQNRVAH
jgi:hypothetical protein